MALQSEVAPVGEAKNNTIDGHESDDDDEGTEEDLEEGEIQDSGEEGENEDIKEKEPPSIVSNSKSPCKNANLTPLGQLFPQSGDIVRIAPDQELKENKFNKPLRRKLPRLLDAYVDHDRIEDELDLDDKKRDKWFERPGAKKFDQPLDYRDELAAYRGSDSSPERSNEKHKKRKKGSKTSRKMAKVRKRRQLEKEGKIRKEIKKKPCKFFQEGHCHKGSECPYQHIPPVPKKRELCRFYISGRCNKKKFCPYMHNDFPCKFFHTGAKCFAGDNCRFSHKPLTAETTKILHDFLKAAHGDDYHHDNLLPRKRDRTPTPEPPPQLMPPSKRVCLLGSPPRHLREAEETKRWQEEMMTLHEEQNNDAFQIFGPEQSMPPSNNYPKANFYGDTMQSPVKQPPKMPEHGPMGMHPMPPVSMPLKMSELGPMGMHPLPHPRLMPPKMPELGLMGMHPLPQRPMLPRKEFGDWNIRPRFEGPVPKEGVDWKNIQALIDMKDEPNPEPTPFKSTAHVESDSTEAFESNTQPQNNDSLPAKEADCTSEDNDASNLSDEKDNKTLKISENFGSEREDSNSMPLSSRSELGNSSPSSMSQVAELPDPDPIVIPQHLPPKQRELLMRIQKHQKLKLTAESDDSNKAEDKTELEPQATVESSDDKKEKTKTEEIDKDEKWDSSDDEDDDDSYDPLTIVLQKLNQSPPPKPKPKENPPPSKEQFKPDISQMLSSIMQKAKVNENRSSTLYQEQDKFWKNILSGTVPPVKPDSTTAPIPANPVNPVTTSDTNAHRPFLLPNPMVAVPDKPKVDIRDPRLKNRDPRTAGSASNTNVNVPKSEISPMVPPILPLDVSTGNHHRDLNSLVPNQTPAVIVEGLKGNIPYRLHGVTPKPLNYTPYLQASHSDPKLLNDPRLRKLLVSGNTTSSVVPSSTEKFICSVPKPTSYLPDLPLFDQIKTDKNDNVPLPAALQEPAPVLDTPLLLDQPSPPIQHSLPKINDPRMRRMDQRRLSGNNNLPHALPFEEPPAPPVSIHLPVVPSPTSHLPRSMTDPRMAKLHGPLDPRRSRIMSESVVKNPAKTPTDLKKPPSPEIQVIAEIPAPSDAEKINKTDEVKNEAQSLKPSEEEKPKKNKAVHRNRKTSMDYASPLNSYDDSRSNETLNYNSYNKRPKKVVPVQPKETISNDVPSVVNIADSPVVPDFSASDNSNLDSDWNDANLASLKDVFKTKDPTASPFC